MALPSWLMEQSYQVPEHMRDQWLKDKLRLGAVGGGLWDNIGLPGQPTAPPQAPNNPDEPTFGFEPWLGGAPGTAPKQPALPPAPAPTPPPALPTPPPTTQPVPAPAPVPQPAPVPAPAPVAPLPPVAALPSVPAPAPVAAPAPVPPPPQVPPQPPTATTAGADSPVNTATPPTPPPETIMQPYVPPPTNPPPAYPTQDSGDVPFGPTWPFDPESDWNDIENAYETRVPQLPGWAEMMGFQMGENIQDQFGTSPTTPQEQFALQQLVDLSAQGYGPGAEESAAAGSMMGALEPGAPGGRAFESIMGAVEPAWRRQQDELYDIYQSDMAKKGLTYSGRYGRGLEGLMGRGGESFAAAMAPYAMRGEELAQQERMGAQSGLMGYGQSMYQRPMDRGRFTIPSLMNYGAGSYNRQWDPYNQMNQLFGSLQGANMAPQQGGKGFWDYAIDIGSMFL